MDGGRPLRRDPGCGLLAQPLRAARRAAGPSPYGPISDTPDENGLRLPAGFTSRVIAITGQLVPNTVLPWHSLPDGGACFPMSDVGWAYTSNSEVPLGGGASMIRFDAGGNIIVKEQLMKLGLLYRPNTPEQFDRLVRADVEKLSNVGKLAGIKLQ